MLKLENTEVIGWEHAIRGMRNPKNSWEKSDSTLCKDSDCRTCPYSFENGCGTPTYCIIGPNDHNLMMNLAAGGPVHAKYRRMIAVYVDITAPLYWWKEYDTYKVGTVANSCSTMHKIHAKEFTIDDFSHEHLLQKDDWLDSFYIYDEQEGNGYSVSPMENMQLTCDMLNLYRKKFLETQDKKYWWQLIQLLPSSYNQKRTCMLNYEVLAGIYPMRKDHKLDEWHTFCHWIEELPYSELIIGENHHVCRSESEQR